MLYFVCDKGCTAVAGEGSVPWSVVDATKLPPAGAVVKRFGEVLREDHSTPSQLSLVDNYQPH